jgi:tRNA pseudouridine38/39 synthase
LEHHVNNTTPLPTIEETLWAALIKGRIIMPTDTEALDAGKLTWEGCDYSKCGRTDRGVSAFGQVIGIRVRSNKPLNGEKDFNPIKDEIRYTQVLNRLLPPDIRVLAWCPSPPSDFNARFSCRERRYRYFFTNPAFNPTFGSSGMALSLTDSDTKRREGWLDIKAMQDAAKRYEGLHDFRNLCKIDPSKQITDFRRRIYHSEIREIDPTQEPGAYVAGQGFSEFGEKSSLCTSEPKVYQFILHGSAFLWHQVRHMVAILFLVGQGLEKPDIVDRMLDTSTCPSKPWYEMADDAPLVLWDCIFPDLQSDNREDSLDWIWVGDESFSRNKHGLGGLVDGLWTVWRQRKIDEILAGSLLNLTVNLGKNQDGDLARSSQKVYFGGNSYITQGKYIPIMNRQRMETPEIINARYAERKGITPKSIERTDTRTDHTIEL